MNRIYDVHLTYFTKSTLRISNLSLLNIYIAMYLYIYTIYILLNYHQNKIRHLFILIKSNNYFGHRNEKLNLDNITFVNKEINEII